MTEAQAYYLSLGTGDVDGGDFHRDDVNLVINCTGVSVLTQDFATHLPKGRSDFYLQYLVKGEMLVKRHSGTQIMVPGQAILYYPHTEYEYSMYGQNEIEYYWVHFTGFDAASLVESCNLPNHTLLDLGIRESLILEFEELFREFIIRDSCFPYMMATRLCAICTGISRRAGCIDSSPAEKQDRICQALTYIHKNYGQDISVEELASLAHLSVSRFRTLFKARTGLSPLDYLTVLRINQARQLMMQTDMSVGEIAGATGYVDQLYFSRIFRKRTGFTPSAYRQNCRGD
ncbi:AraC family transcriptional regulator [Ruminococcaceae bacterium OttesenSCG-928-L11]|nr:AraC family transcriptional regulator [Ruminococcaceae bacterium OttesenSCG-928-L11]